MKKLIFLIIISIAICSIYYHGARSSILHGRHIEYKITNFLSLQKGLDQYRKEQPYFWRARIVSCYLASKFCYLLGSSYDKLSRSSTMYHFNKKYYREYISDLNLFLNSAALWNTLFIAAVLLLVIVCSKNKVLFVLGFGTALGYAWLPIAEGQYTPWDGISLLAWTMILFINTSKYKKNIIWIIPLSAFLKESVVVTPFLILFWNKEQLNKRLLYFAITIISVIVVRCLTNYIGHGTFFVSHCLHYDKPCRTGEYWIFMRNIHSLFWWNNFNPVILASAGLWVGTFIFNLKTEYKVLSGMYLILLMITGVIGESRLFHELIPVFFIGIEHSNLEVV